MTRSERHARRGRRPSSGNVDQDIASLNLTLNTFLGSPQKSWMLGYHPNVPALAPTIANRGDCVPAVAAASVSAHDAAAVSPVPNLAGSTQQPRPLQNEAPPSLPGTELPSPVSVER